MEYVALTAATVAFTLGLHFLRVVAQARRIMAASAGALATIRLSTLPDEEKETAVQRAAVDVFTALGALLAGVGASLLLSVAVIWAGTLLGAYSVEALVTAAANWYFIAGSTLFVVAAMLVLR